MAARGAIAVQEINRNAGAVITETAIGAGGVADGLTLLNDGKTILFVHNTGAGIVTVTCKAVPCSHGRSVDLASGNVAAGASYRAGPFEAGMFNQATGVINVDFGGAGVDQATTKVGAIRTP